MKTSRRGFIGLLAAAVAAPEVVRSVTVPDGMTVTSLTLENEPVYAKVVPVQLEIGGVCGVYEPEGGPYIRGSGPSYQTELRYFNARGEDVTEKIEQARKAKTVLVRRA